MKKITRYWLAFLAGLFLAGCTTVKELPAESLTTEPTTPEYRKARKLMTAFLENDPDTFVSLLPEDKQQAFDANRFRTYRFSIVDSLGEPKSFRYLTTLQMPVFTPFVWQVAFERTGKEGDLIHGEALFRVITGKSGDEILIVSFQFL